MDEATTSSKSMNFVFDVEEGIRIDDFLELISRFLSFLNILVYQLQLIYLGNYSRLNQSTARMTKELDISIFESEFAQNDFDSIESLGERIRIRADLVRSSQYRLTRRDPKLTILTGIVPTVYQLTIKSINYGSPISISLGGWIPETINAIREWSKDRRWRDKVEEKKAEQELIWDQLQLQAELIRQAEQMTSLLLPEDTLPEVRQAYILQLLPVLGELQILPTKFRIDDSHDN